MAGARARPLKVGIFFPHGERDMAGATPRWSDILALARRAEELGFDSFWLPDHLLFRFPNEEPQGLHECWSLLAAIAASTSKIEIGPFVACAGFRNPALLAKMADTIDEISGGRLILGLGAGWHEPEFRAFDFPFDHRVARFEEAIFIIHSLLRSGKVDFEGRFHVARDCELRPRGPRFQGPPTMIGTVGARMLESTARYADSWNAFFWWTENSLSGVRSLRPTIDAACERIGRRPETLERTVCVLLQLPGFTGTGFKERPLTGSPEEIANEFRAYAAEGITHLQVRLDPNSLAGLELLAPVLELLDRA